GGEHPKPRGSVGNVVVVLTYDPRYAGAIRYNEFSGAIEYQGARIRDVDEAIVAMEVAEAYGLHVSSAKASEAMMIVAERHRYHPVREYLERLRWDGQGRLAGWLHRYMEAPSDSLVSEFGLRWMIGAVARVMRPGCKMDNTLILVGAQGARKSTALRTLAGGWFADATIDVRNKDAYAALDGVWVYEWGELDNMRRADSTAIKSYLTSQVDHYRPAYGRHVVQVPRQTVFVGTTNEDTFLTDSTGSRRFWPVTVGRIDLPGLEAARDQLWAEALVQYRAGERWWLDEETEAARAEDAAGYSHVDPWTQPIEAFVRLSAPCSVADVLSRALDKPAQQQTRADAMRVAGILQELGLVKQRVSMGGRREVVWRVSTT
ncbi:MAG: VapE domain-containing protein, partial [Miltoncostaeaceae bacterium]